MAKKQLKNKRQSKVWEKYRVEGEKLIRARYCQRCGAGSFMGEHKDRFYCGKCGMVIMKEKK